MAHRSFAAGARAVLATAAGLIIAACIVQQEPQPNMLPANQAAPGEMPADQPGGLAEGDYSCSIEDSGYQYPPFRCIIYRADNGGHVLEKVGGSQRFRGSVLPEGDGFRFDGTFYCPYGDCTENVSGTFAAAGSGMYRGSIQASNSQKAPITVSLQHTPGGFGYGGVGYGGAGYAAPPPPPPTR
jgi:hypothetical protein